MVSIEDLIEATDLSNASGVEKVCTEIANQNVLC